MCRIVRIELQASAATTTASSSSSCSARQDRSRRRRPEQHKGDYQANDEHCTLDFWVDDDYDNNDNDDESLFQPPQEAIRNDSKGESSAVRIPAAAAAANHAGRFPHSPLMIPQPQQRRNPPPPALHHHHHHDDARMAFWRQWPQPPPRRLLVVLQAMQRLAKQEGGLYRGVGPMVWTTALSNLVFFGVFTYLRKCQLVSSKLRLGGSSRKRITPSSTSRTATTTAAAAAMPSSSSLWLLWADTLVASILGGILNVLITNPLWVANLRIATGQAKHESLFHELRYLVQQSSTSWRDGVRHLWKGTVPSLLLVANPVVQQVVYEQIKEAAWQWQQQSPTTTTTAKTLSPLAAFGTGAVAKALATILTYPLQLTQSILRLQEQQQQEEQQQHQQESKTTTNTKEEEEEDHNHNSHHHYYYKGTWDCLQQLYSRGGGGIQAWYTGLEAKLLQTVLTAALTYLTYEQILRVVGYALHYYYSDVSNHKSRRKPPLEQRQQQQPQ